MKAKTKLAAVLVLAFAGAFAAVAQQQSLTGVVTDSMCGATLMAKDKTSAQCTQMCVKDGMKYALAAEKRVYIGRTRSGTRQARWPESHGQGNSEGRHAFRQ